MEITLYLEICCSFFIPADLVAERFSRVSAERLDATQSRTTKQLSHKVRCMSERCSRSMQQISQFSPEMQQISQKCSICAQAAGKALLHCTALHCTALHCTALHCTALHCTALQRRREMRNVALVFMKNQQTN